MIKGQNTDMAMAFASASVSAAQNRLQAARAKAQKEVIQEKLFTALALSGEIHARRILMHLRGKLQDPEKHIADSISLSYELFSQHYPKLAEKAEKKSVSELCEHLTRVTEGHHALLNRHLSEKIDSAANFHVCSVCGHIAANGVPERCPVCNAVSERFNSL